MPSRVEPVTDRLRGQSELNVSVRHTAAIVLLALVTGCGLIATDPPSTTVTSEVPAVESTTPTSFVSDELTTTPCPTDEAAFAPVCEAYELILDNYVDPVDSAVLAEAALLGVQALATSGTAPGPLTCPLPDPAFLPVCEELDALDVGADALESILYGMAEFGLDDNSTYITPEALALVQEQQTGSVEGIGALVITEDRASADPENTVCNIVTATCPLVIVSTLPGSPAAAAGVQPDDVFLTVDGVSVIGRSIDEITAAVRGPAGTDVDITFDRAGKVVDVTITRSAIEIPVTVAESFGSVGYLRLNQFTGNAGEQVEDDLRALLDGGATTIVLDLRDNPGGTLDSALDVTSQFLEEGPIVRTVGPDEERSYSVREGGLATDPAIELIVVVNRGSASASEVLAGALQERGRALIVGETTFGKNTVQQRFGLSNGGAIRLTIARWITPGGLDFDNGIVPDVIVELDPALTPAELLPLVVPAF
ncbi:MAG: S41 family peptidase [Acidimicrobiia bacterium]